MTVGRITNASATRSVLASLQASIGRVEKLQNQLASGKVIQRPSDDPGGALIALQDRSAIRRQEQYQRNANDGVGWLNSADSALSDLGTTIRRARDLVLQGANATMTPSDREAIAAEIDAIRQGALQVANSRYLDQPLFGGTTTGDVAFEEVAGTVTYQGDTGEVRRTLAPSVSVPVNVDGIAVFGPDGENLFETLSAISAHLRSGDAASLAGADLGALDAHRRRIQDVQSSVGARTNRVEAMQQLAESTAADLTTRLAEVESVDIPKTIMELQLQQTAYEAALAAGAKVLQRSLVDFLR